MENVWKKCKWKYHVTHEQKPVRIDERDDFEFKPSDSDFVVLNNKDDKSYGRARENNHKQRIIVRII